MANSETGSRASGTDHDFLAAFLAGEVQRRHLDSLKAAGAALHFPGAGEDVDAPELEAQFSENSDPGCSCIGSCASEHPACDTEVQCHTRPPHCKTHEHECKTDHHECKTQHECKHKPEHEPPKHASWFDR